jgi:hypothetical protein
MRAHRKIGSKEAAMPTRRFKIALAQLLLSGCAVMFGVCVLIEHAQAQPSVPTGPIPTPPTQSPTFNPSNPGTVPQPPYTPITPTTPSAAPGYVVTSPMSERLPRTAARSHHPRRASVYGTRSVFGPIVIGPPWPVAYSYVGYGYPCAWQRSWDGYWFRTSPCSW